MEAAGLAAAKEFNLDPFHRSRLLLRERLGMEKAARL
jgi:hypothetical protein